MEFINWFKQSHGDVQAGSIESVLKLTEEGATVPFIARYRKEQTGNLDEVEIRKIIDAKESWDEILKRQKFIVEEIKRQEKLTGELEKKILGTFSLEKLEDIYLPFKQKRKTKAAKAKELGLEPLAQWIWDQGRLAEKADPLKYAEKFVGEGVPDVEKALAGAQDILIERLAEIERLRQQVRDAYFKQGFVKSKKGTKAQPQSKVERYFDYSERVSVLLQPQNSHRYLAMRRGWLEEELKVTIGGDEEFETSLLKTFEFEACPNGNASTKEILFKAAKMALKAHVQVSIDSEVHAALKKVADEAAIKVFSENVRKLLLASPFGPKAVLGVDPGLRTGCKIALVSDSGKFLADTVMHLQSHGEQERSKKMLKEILETQKIQAVAVGNGTAGRETESFFKLALKELGSKVPVVMVNESGASVYSASETAREEFPDQDVTVRGAISIARRLQDPLAELVKIDPKSIGVGQYQHDVSPQSLSKSLDAVVDSCVNQVGVNLNTASYHLLSHVSGIGPGLAKSVVEYRNKNGIFKSRTDLLEVPRFSKKSFEQAAGFLRIKESPNPLDNTGVHPERYKVLESLAGKLGKKVQDLIGSGAALVRQQKELRQELGAFTFEDIVAELEKPGRDPREAFLVFSYREDIQELKDLKIGMQCPGIVTNVTNFGAFVDIGVHQDGLVHISQLSDKFVKDPREVVSPGDHVRVKVLEINLEKRQIALTMKSGERPAVQPSPPKPQSFSNNPFSNLKRNGS